MNIVRAMLTAEEIIKAFGGNTKMAERFSVLPSAVSNWKADGRFPSRLHMPIYLALREMGQEAEPGDIPVSDALAVRTPVGGEAAA